MKRLTFMRHGKSSWKYDLSDRERPLKERGMRDAERIAEKYNDRIGELDRICTSPALRALRTAQIAASAWKWDMERFLIREEIYDFGGDRLFAFIQRLENHWNHVLIVGHNEALTELVNRLGSVRFDNLPTAGLVEIEFPVHRWEEVSLGETKLWLIPSQLRDI